MLEEGEGRAAVPEAPRVRDLYSMLSISRDCSTEQLRTAYERAIDMATRSGDHSHMLALSKAYDALSATHRTSMYSALGSATTTLHKAGQHGRRRGSDHAGGRDSTSRPGLGGAEVRPRRHRLIRFFAYGLGIPAAVVLGVVFLQDRGPAPMPQLPMRVNPRAPVADNPVPTVLPTAAVRTNARQIPLDAPVDAQGRVQVMCQVYAGGGGYVVYAEPGSVVSCPNGAVPAIG